MLVIVANEDELAARASFSVLMYLVISAVTGT
jgi:hypothetical protein